MIPSKNTMTNTDTMPGEEIEFSIGDPRWVMRTQAELYSDVTTAIIREYSTNAYDAHVMAGHNDPIEVTLPSALNKFFIVKDHGVGMNVQLFRDVYTKFGTSDKRGSNETNGMLGYGSKSGVAYTDQFTVTSVRDGRKVEGVITRRSDWSIVLKVVSESATDEPNGTIVKILVHNVDEFNRKAHDFYKFWLPGRVLINGKPPVHNVGAKITDTLYHATGWGNSYVVLGNVPYRINNPSALFSDSKMSRINFVAYVDNLSTTDGGAAVDFTPSREDLAYTPKTLKTLSKVISDFEKEIVDKAKAEVAAVTTHADAYKIWSKWTSTLGTAMFGDLSFKGDPFVSAFEIKGTRYQTRGYGVATERITRWNVEAMDNTMVITEFPIQVSTSVRKKVREYASQVGWSVHYYLFTPAADVSSPWISKDKFVKWEDLKAALPKTPKAPSVGPGYGRVKGSFDYFTTTRYESEQPLPKDLTVYYALRRDVKKYNIRDIMKRLGMKSAAVVDLPANREAKFKRENPTVREFISYAKSRVVLKGETLLSDAAKKAMAIDYSTDSWLNVLSNDVIDDPEIVAYIEARKNKDTLTAAYEANRELARVLKMRYANGGGYVDYAPVKAYSIMDKYPLLKEIRWAVRNPHVALYINAAYAARKDNNA